MDYSPQHGMDVHTRITSPTCEDLGIPHDAEGQDINMMSPFYQTRLAGGRHFDGQFATHQDPFSSFSQIPLPAPFGAFDYGLEPAFIRKRNERERERVRCVNEGYARLRDHLPLDNKDKRISKVETLRAAIKYIKGLQHVLTETKARKRPSSKDDDERKEDAKPAKRRALQTKSGQN